jgi:hypothetical protein
MGRERFCRAVWIACLALPALTAGCQAPDTSPSRAPTPGGSVAVTLPGDAPRDGGAGDGNAMDAATVTASVLIAAPADGASFVRDDVEASEWVASVDFSVTSAGVASVELVADTDFPLGNVDAAGALTYAFHGDGVRVIDAIGRDASGAEVARDTISITITPPVDTGCHAMLDALGIDWAAASATRGITDPVRVQPVIHGVSYRYVDNTTPTAMLMACELAPRLAMLSDLVSEYGIDEIIHIGIYNYRCIGGGDPDVDGCTPSQHAYARAIDLHAFGLAGSDVEYSTETDFVITRRSDTCPMAYSSEADRVLKELACRMYEDRIFQIVLTPNYNADHRNHFHVDLTTGSMFLGEGVEGVDPAVTGLGD